MEYQRDDPDREPHTLRRAAGFAVIRRSAHFTLDRQRPRGGREMALSQIHQAQVTKQLTAFCDARVPPTVRDKLRVGFRIKGNEVVLFEERPEFHPPHKWREM